MLPAQVTAKSLEHCIEEKKCQRKK